MNKIHSRFTQAVKNGPGYLLGWHFAWDGSERVVLVHHKEKKIKPLSKNELLFLVLSGLDKQIESEAKNKILHAIFNKQDITIGNQSCYFHTGIIFSQQELDDIKTI
jgi:hypothetical protein